jgi:hypothetical protein
MRCDAIFRRALVNMAVQHGIMDTCQLHLNTDTKEHAYAAGMAIYTRARTHDQYHDYLWEVSLADQVFTCTRNILKDLWVHTQQMLPIQTDAPIVRVINTEQLLAVASQTSQVA